MNVNIYICQCLMTIFYLFSSDDYRISSTLQRWCNGRGFSNKTNSWSVGAQSSKSYAGWCTGKLLLIYSLKVCFV